MINFFYDSLEAVRQLKHPTKKQYTQLSVAIFVAIVFWGLLFIGLDTVFQWVYRIIYTMFTAG